MVSERIMLAQQLWHSIVDEDAPIELTEKQKGELDRRLQVFYR